MLCFLYNLPGFHPESLEMSRAPLDTEIRLRQLGSHFDSFKPSCSVAQSVSFFW